MFFRKRSQVDFNARQEEREALFARALGPRPRPSGEIDNRKSVVQQLMDRNLLGEAQARAAAFEAKARGLTVPTVLAEIGAVPAEKIVEAVETTNAALLASGLEFDVRLPRSVLIENRICIHAQTDDRIVVSSTTSFNIVRQLLAEYVEGRQIIEVPFSFVKWGEFAQGIGKIMEPGDELRGFDDPLNPRSVIPDDAEDAEVLDLLIDRATVFKASDVHIEPGKNSYDVFFRTFGIRTMVHCGTIDQFNRLIAMVKDRARLDPMETRVPQDGSFSLKVRGRPFDVRVATVPTDGAEKITMRLLDPVRAQMQLKQLGIGEVDTWRAICGYRNGIVLIVGSTGSGKTTTLNATIREMDRYGRCIYTAEDPVEYRIDSVSHVQMNESVGLDYARAIRAFMRADPDIIVLGEIRDNMTASKAIQAAETGHLVIATIHAESVPMAIQRLKGLDVKIEDFEMLLKGILVQFLVRTLCGDCGGKGCNTCMNTGYNGRTVVSEIARVNKPIDVQRILRSEKDPSEKYWRPLWKDLEAKITSGITDGREIYRAFSSELEEMSEHSEILRKIYLEERAKRGLVTSAVDAAQISALSPVEKRRQRKMAQERLNRSKKGQESAKTSAVKGSEQSVEG